MIQTDAPRSVRDLLPHEPPMILLDCLLEQRSEFVRCGVQITEQSMFFEDGGVPGEVAIEYMAQAVGVYGGLDAISKNEVIGIGFIVAVREFDCFVERFDLGDQLIVDVTHLWGESSLGRFEAEVRRGEDLAAKATISVYVERENQP